MKKRQAMYPQLWGTEGKSNRTKRVARKRSKPRVVRETSGSSSMEYSADVEEAAVSGVIYRNLCVGAGMVRLVSSPGEGEAESQRDRTN